MERASHILRPFLLKHSLLAYHVLFERTMTSGRMHAEILPSCELLIAAFFSMLEPRNINLREVRAISPRIHAGAHQLDVTSDLQLSAQLKCTAPSRKAGHSR